MGFLHGAGEQTELVSFWVAQHHPADVGVSDLHDPVLGRLGAEGGCCQRLVHVLGVGARDQGLAAGADVEAGVAAAFDALVGLFGGTAPTGWIGLLRSGKTPTVSVRRRISRLRLVGPSVCVGDAKPLELPVPVTPRAPAVVLPNHDSRRPGARLSRLFVRSSPSCPVSGHAVQAADSGSS